MSYRWRSSVYRSAGFLILLAAMPSGWSQTAARSASQIPRMPGGKPNFTGLWQSLGTAYWDIEDHSAHAGAFFQLGATGAEPAGQGIVEGGEIPYTPAAAAKKPKISKTA